MQDANVLPQAPVTDSPPNSGRPGPSGSTGKTTDAIDPSVIAGICGLKKRSLLEAAHAELERELTVRDRCYPGWVKDGKLARIDARDRYDRLCTAVGVLQNLLDRWEDPTEGTGTNGEMPF